ncbi:bicyclomycin/multidrug efflux system, partial [Pasteurella multocida subsp. gallicida str. Anand1_poultry]
YYWWLSGVVVSLAYDFLCHCGNGDLVLPLTFFVVPETHQKGNRQPLHLRIISRNFFSLWQQKEVLGYMFSSAFGFGGLFAFITAGSIVYIGLYGVAVEKFWLFLHAKYWCHDFQFFLNRKWVTKLGAETMLRLGLSVQFIAAVALVCISL